MKVYLVFKAYPYEGEHLQGIFDSLEKANELVLELVKSQYDSNDWKQIEQDDGTLYFKNYDSIYSEIHEVL